MKAKGFGVLLGGALGIVALQLITAARGPDSAGPWLALVDGFFFILGVTVSVYVGTLWLVAMWEARVRAVPSGDAGKSRE